QIGSSSSRRGGSSRWDRTRNWFGRAATTPRWCIGNIAVSSLKNEWPSPLHALASRPQTLLEICELFRDRRMLFIREGELCQQLERPLIGQSRTIEVPPLLIAVAECCGIEMPAHDGDLRLEMFE